MESDTLLPDFKDLLKSLNAHEVDYIVVGGYAVIAHGYVRTTKDLDVWICPELSNAHKVAALLESFFGSQIQPQRLISPRLLLRIGCPPGQVELMTSVLGLSYRQCRQRAIEIEMDEVKFPVLNLDDLRQSKAASGRPQDLADLDNLPER